MRPDQRPLPTAYGLIIHMLTECPACLTVFRVTAAILKMGHGQVRCGKCRKQFDAIQCMLDDEEPEAPEATSERASGPPPTTQQAPTAPTKDDDEEAAEIEIADIAPNSYAEEVIMEGSRIEISGTYRVLTDGKDTGDEIIRERVVIDRGGAPEEMNSSGDSSQADREEEEEVLDLSEEDDEPVAEAANHLLEDSQELPAREGGAVTEAPALPKRWRRTLSQRAKGGKHAVIREELTALTNRERPRVLRTGVWATLSALFAIALLVQLVHHHRDDLVRDSRFGATFSRLYRVLGMSPTPHWDLRAYKWDFYEVGLDPNVRDALRVVGSVANDASFAQPYPFGKLSLQDRWGSPVGERAFAPSEYLPSAQPADRLMAPKQRSNIEIVIADPGADAVGYTIYACLEQDRHMMCADQLPVFKGN